MLKTELTDNLLVRDLMPIWMISSDWENPSDKRILFLVIPRVPKDIKDNNIEAL